MNNILQQLLWCDAWFYLGLVSGLQLTKGREKSLQRTEQEKLHSQELA